MTCETCQRLYEALKELLGRFGRIEGNPTDEESAAITEAQAALGKFEQERGTP